MKEIKPIAFFKSPFDTKFGVPRQSGLVGELRGRIVFTAEFRNEEALRGLDKFDWLWIIWGFSANNPANVHPTVRPPRLGGNERIGVFASRSPFRPNGLGLSSVHIAKIGDGYVEVLGADLMDGTPIYDIKPYIAYTDSHPDAAGGFTDEREWEKLKVAIPDSLQGKFSKEDLAALRDVLSLDPRPHYHDDPERVYGMSFAGKDVRFKVADGTLAVVEIIG